MATYTYEVIEDKDGGVHLFVFDNDDNVIYARANFQYKSSYKLREILESLESGLDICTLEGCWDAEKEGRTMQEFYDSFTEEAYDRGEWQIIASESCVYPERMGEAGRMCFLPEKK